MWLLLYPARICPSSGRPVHMGACWDTKTRASREGEPTVCKWRQRSQTAQQRLWNLRTARGARSGYGNKLRRNSLGAWRRHGASQTEPGQYQFLNTRCATSTSWSSVSKVWRLGYPGQNFPGGVISSEIFSGALTRTRGSSSSLRQAVMVVVGVCP